MSKRSATFRPAFLARLIPAGRWKLLLNRSRSSSIRINNGTEIDVPCLDVTSISTSKALLWHTVEVRSRGRIDQLSCLGEDAATKLAADLYTFINNNLSELIGSETDRLGQVGEKLRTITDGQRQYLAHADLSRAIASVPGNAAVALSHPLFDPELMPPRLRASLPQSLGLLTDPAARGLYNDKFVHAELGRYHSFFDNLVGRSLSDQQREACIRLEDNNLLIASAGSGKSATMVGKVAYVLDKRLYQPDEILVLAFNKKAAEELRERISRQLGVNPEQLTCKVTTFHALGRGIIQETEGKPPQLADWVEHPAGEARVIETIIDQLVRTDAEFSRLWINLLVIHPKADIPAEAFDSKADHDRYLSVRRRKGNATVGTLAGIYVKSLQEQSIVNWLWLNSVAFEYERQIPIDEEDGTVRHVHPDFYYPATDTIHEHLAINADGSSPFADYSAHAESKLAAYRKAELDVIQTTSAQSSDGSLLTVLESELSQRGVPVARKSYADIVKALEPVVIKHYHKLISVCIKHIRASHLTLDMLLERAKSLHDKPRAAEFARVVWKITEAYSTRLDTDRRIDFDSMIANATQLVETGEYKSPYSLILVDEFHDISESRAKLINQLIAETAASFVQRNPLQLRKPVRSSRPAIAKSIRVVPIEGEHGKPDFAAACHRLLTRLDGFLGGISAQWQNAERPKLKVMVLWRYNQLDPFGRTRPSFANIEVSGMSFHRAKGLEADYTILLDVCAGDYGVPSRIEDDELLNLVMPRPETFEYAEERRLFYVALTRASRGVFLLTNSREPSGYIRELSEIAGDNLRFETIDGEPVRQCPTCQIGQLVERKGRNNRRFVGCNQFPECDHTQAS